MQLPGHATALFVLELQQAAREVPERFLRLLANADIAQQQADASRGSVRGEHPADPPQKPPTSTLEVERILDGFTGARLQYTDERLEEGTDRLLPEKVAGRMADQLFLGAWQERFISRPDVQGRALFVKLEGHVVNRFDQSAQPELVLPQLLSHAFALQDFGIQSLDGSRQVGGALFHPALKLVVGNPQRCLGLAALGNGRGEDQSGHCGHAHEGLQEEERGLRRVASEGAEALERGPGRNPGNCQHGGGRLARPESKGGPGDHWETEKNDRMVLVCEGAQPAEDHLRHQQQTSQEGRSLGESHRSPAKELSPAPQQEHGSQYDHTSRVAEPPGEPDGAIIAPSG